MLNVCMHAKLLQSCLTLCNPMDYSPAGSSVHRDSPGKNTGAGSHAVLQGVFLTQGLNPYLSYALAGMFLPLLGFPSGSDGTESDCNAGDLGSIPGLGRSPGRGQGNPLQYSCLENPYGQMSLEGYSPWGHKELDTNE